MTILAKLTLRFTLIVASILALFSFSIYFSSEFYRQEEFYTRLESRAVTTARLLVTVQEVDNHLLRIIDKNSIHAMYQEKVLVFNPDNKLVYSSLDDLEIDHSPDVLDEVRKKHKIEYSQSGVENVGVLYESAEGQYVVLSSAYDLYGKSKLRNLRYVLLVGFCFGIAVAFLAGIIFARLILRPLANINEQVSGISAGNLQMRINGSDQKDEIALLAANFNNMLERLESAFEVQKQFVSSASHELRTPLAAISTQLQLILKKTRSSDYYQSALQSILDDTQTLVELTNGLLTLAQSDLEKQQFKLTAVRIDETLFSAQNELLKMQPDYRFIIEYESPSDDESLYILNGSEHLLKTAFINLMDNGCKFSENHTVHVRLKADTKKILISFKDNGIGIPEEEMEQIFSPFFRGSNILSLTKGHGIGLSLCQRIIKLHDGTISIESELGKGSCFTVELRQS